MECRPGCGVCCMAISISSPIPGMPNGKPAGVPCAHLTEDGLCDLFGKAERPAICSSFSASPDVCGANREEALKLIEEMEKATAPNKN